MPTPKVENLFTGSFDRSLYACRAKAQDAQRKNLQLENTNYDVGVITPAGKYRLNDDTYAHWLHMLAERRFGTVTQPIEGELLSFYSDLNAPLHTKSKPKEWNRLTTELNELKTAKTSAVSGQP